MSLPPILSWLLIVAGIWPLLIWPAFLRRVLKDPRSRDGAGKYTRFLLVHFMLVSISMILGLATAVVGIRTLING